MNIPENSQQPSVDALKQAGFDNDSNVAMFTVDPEADAQLTLQSISWRHITAKGTAKSFIQTIPAQISPYRSVTAHCDITIAPVDHRFIVTSDKGKRKWIAFDHDG
jgi:hypothetical protein